MLFYLSQDGYFSADGLKCKKCSDCYKGQKTSTKCFPDRDTVCVCPPGKYLNVDRCSPCTNCPMGYRQTGGCESNKNRDCEVCKPVSSVY